MESLTIYYRPEQFPDLNQPDPHQDLFSMRTLGFWIYLMTDCVLFATLFACYAVLHPSTFGGPNSHDLFDLKLTFTQTMILLFSSLSCGLSVLASCYKSKRQVLAWLAATFVLGAAFIALEAYEFTSLVQDGHAWDKSAFLSAFFALVGTHGLHVSFGLLWLAVMFLQILFLGIDTDTFRRLTLFSMFWHFLDLIWIFIFTFVYLLGVI